VVGRFKKSGANGLQQVGGNPGVIENGADQILMFS
jgi:hypothetical protein